MDEYQSLIGLVSMTMGVAWASGINLYAALAVLGFSGSLREFPLKGTLRNTSQTKRDEPIHFTWARRVR